MCNTIDDQHVRISLLEGMKLQDQLKSMVSRMEEVEKTAKECKTSVAEVTKTVTVVRGDVHMIRSKADQSCSLVDFERERDRIHN